MHFTFTLTDFETGRLLGLALACPEARYASVLAVGSDRFERRHALPSHWKELEVDLTRLQASPLDRSSTIVRPLLDVDGRSNVIVRPLTGVPADGEPEHGSVTGHVAQRNGGSARYAARAVAVSRSLGLRARRVCELNPGVCTRVT